MLLDDLPTPALLVDEARLHANLDRMQARAVREGVALRPHLKTHKSARIAAMQRERGARGVTVAKPSEAAVFVEAGFDDVRVAYPVVGAFRHEILAGLMDRARISFCVDTLEGARAASAFYSQHGLTADVLVEVDTGYGRTGIGWDDEDAAGFARAVADLPGLRLAGLLTHEGDAYNGPREGQTAHEALRHAMCQGRDRLLMLAQSLGAAGLARPGAFEVSVGSTPSMSVFENAERGGFRVTEIRPGNYCFFDAMQVALGACRLEDCALTALATVVSKHEGAAGTQRVYLDAGKKTLTSDRGYGTDVNGAPAYGRPLYNARTMRDFPHLRITALSEEHAWCEVYGSATLAVGDRVRLVPNHACVAVATQDVLHLARGEEVIETLPVDARGCVA